MNHLKVSGSGALIGGEYGEVALSGSNVISSDIKCKSCSASGALKAEAVACSERMQVNGACRFTGTVAAERFVLSGSLSCREILCGSASLKGSVAVAERITAKEYAVIQGAIQCQTLSAERVSIVFDGKSEILAIKGCSVSVTKKKHLLPMVQELCVTNSVEADEVSLSYLVCPRVVGKRVVIGKGCEIDLVQYSETAEISPDAKVKKIEKI